MGELKKTLTRSKESEVRSSLRRIVEDVLTGRISCEAELEAAKKDLASAHRLSSLPSNSDILALARDDERPRLKQLVRKPTRTLSGVAVIAAMTSPYSCPHGRCLPCPGGIGLDLSSPQSYTGREPAALRAGQHAYDPYDQVSARLSQLEEIGHPVDKAELIIMGGTITSRPLGYQSWFVKSCISAMNDHPNPRPRSCRGWRSFEDVCIENSASRTRNVGITFETRPDWCTDREIKRMLSLGVTKVELGVQSVDDGVLQMMCRGHSVSDTISANRLLRDAGLKVGFHMMPGLPGSSPEDDLRGFVRLFGSPDFRPDYLKIYPTLVIKGTPLYDLFIAGKYSALNDMDAANLVSKVKEILPEYTRLQRVQRDIPAPLIEAGVKKSNLRQLARSLLEDRGGACRCIRCREAGQRGLLLGGEGAVFKMQSYQACGAEERFLSFEWEDSLVGFLRLRLGSGTTARVRELHIYGPLVPLGMRGGWQHQGYGARLLMTAEEQARDAGYDGIEVTSGVGVRSYYGSLGYRRSGCYMRKDL
jgi:elongator complex protein 3